MVSLLMIDGEGEGHLPTTTGHKKETKSCLPESDDREPNGA